jgi:RHS repeat-associated protein
MAAADKTVGRRQSEARFAAPSLSLPKGGGAIRGIGEKFGNDPVTGTGAMSIPIDTSPGRSGFGPQIVLNYDSGAGNGPFGVGWTLSLGSITRKTDRGLPQYRDAEESDDFLLSGAEDLVPMLDAGGNRLVDNSVPTYIIERYRPRIEGAFARIERWTRRADGDVHWRTLSADNVLAIYGRAPRSRIADFGDASRVFSWLLCETRDDCGNGIVIEYKPEDAADVDVTQPHELHRGGANNPARKANRHIKSIRYGNRVSLLDSAGRRPIEVAPEALQNAGWMFEVVFDYGEHDAADPKPGDAGSWLCRNDPFSSHRPGFEVRTYRLCQRVLMYHHFPAEAGVGEDCLVRSTDFAYRESRGMAEDRKRGHPLGSFLATVTHSGYLRKNGGGYTRQSLPPLSFAYSQATVSSAVQVLDAGSLENLPEGVDSARYQWIDLDGEGLPGILTEQAGAWHYKPNFGDGRFGPQERVTAIPSAANLRGSRQLLLDLTGDGQIELVQFDAKPAGFFERSNEEGWSNFVPFEQLPNIDWASPNLQFVDLTGDGHADLLLTEDEVITWYPSLGEQGFGPAQRQPQPLDERHGPRLVLADGTQTIFLADMSGDGLSDLVRIRNGEVCYFANLGYGRFGSRVTMSDAPWFDRPDRFDPGCIRLADIDGSGVVDIIYIGAGEIRLWHNQCGNRWSASQRLPDFPHLDNHSAVDVVDLLGNGTACVVWSSPLPVDAARSLHYIDLMGGTKPHLLIKVENNLGAESRMRYAASTKFYLSDRRAGRPWITRLPFPVHVVEHVEHIDRVSRTRFASRYSYHHGYFDGVEREFRGFAMVEQHDTEAFEDYVVGVRHIEGTQELAPELYQPPVTTRTWFHTGAFLHGVRILHQLRDEYYLQQQHIPEPVLPDGMDESEFRECVRALKGLPLRQEVYSFDASAQAQHPYSVVENNYDVKRLQPRDRQRNAVFFSYGCETVTHSYERNPADPRIAHQLSLEIGPYGNVVKSASVVYGREIADPLLTAEITADQQRLYVTYGEIDYTPDIDLRNPIPAYRLRTARESRDYEITGVAPASRLFTLAELKEKIASATPLDYEIIAAGPGAQRRLLAQSRTLFRDNALAVLPLGQWDTLGLPYESYRLAFTPAVVNAHYSGKIADADFLKAGYVHFNGDANWWIPSGIAVFPNDAATRFYMPRGARDPLGVETTAVFDSHHLLTERVSVTGAAWNEVRATNDYRVLGPVMITDPNRNRTAVEIDALGMVVASAVMGKVGAGEGDTLADPTERMEYELFNWMNNRKPNFAHVFAREKHGAANLRWQESYVYSNGGGGVAMVKAKVHPGKALRVNADGTVSEVDADPRWVGNGRTITNNKGAPVKQYEPFFSTTHEYEDEEALRTIGATPVRHYDALGRNVRTDSPDGTFARVEFDPWKAVSFDANDTVLQSRWYADRGSPDPLVEPEPVNEAERRAAWLAARHANTPSIAHFDSLGRPVAAVADYGGGRTALVRTETDLTGRYSRLFDQHQRQVAAGFTGMAGTPIHADGAEKGNRRGFLDVLGKMVRSWDEFNRTFSIEYDPLHRPLSAFVEELGGPKILVNYIVYGDRHPDALQRNLNGAAHQVFDSAGMMRVPAFDFKGNPVSVDRALAADYKVLPNWSALPGQPDYPAVQSAAAALLTAESFAASSTYDALSRPIRVTLHGGTIMSPTYNEANFLASLKVQIEGTGPLIEFLKEQDYDAKGNRQFARYGNDSVTRYFYDPKSFRLTSLLTLPTGADPATQSLQNFHYTYDAVGNLTQQRDDAQQTHFFANAVVKAEGRYEYDALYHLIKATGRELAGLINDAIRDDRDIDFVAEMPHVNNVAAVRSYTQHYDYDLMGNLLRMRHVTGASASSWTRHYHYAYQDAPANRTNRLLSTSRPGDPAAGPYTATYDYDHYGNMTRLRTPNPGEMTWSSLEQLQKVDLGGGGTAFYVYGVSGQRIRKVIERPGGARIERIYLGGLEIYRERRNNDPPHLERRTLHVSDDTGRIAQVDIKLRDDNNVDPANPLVTPLIRYQYGNHLGSATLETNSAGTVISYEEYHPFGTTAYRSGRPGTNLSLKRYRFTGKERDNETGLDYFGARYYASWLGRWISTDPAGFVDGFNLYRYCRNNPIMLRDPDGCQPPDQSRCMMLLATPENVYFRMVPHPSGSGMMMVACDPNATGHEQANPTQAPEGGTAPRPRARRRRRVAPRAAPPPPEPSPPPDPEPTPEASPTPAETPPTSPPEVAAPAEPPTQSTPTPAPDEAGLSPTASSARGVLEEAVRPRSVTGGRPRGILHLWSDDAIKRALRALIARQGSGWMMGDIGGSPTPEHAAGEAEFARARARTPGGRLPQAEMDRIWGPRSASVVGRGAFSGHPVESHGTPGPTSIQRTYEWPARAWGGGIRGPFLFGTGLFTAIMGGQDPNPAVGFPLVLFGVGEATSGIIYGGGAILGSTEAMVIGAAGATAFAGAAAALGFGAASYRAFGSGDNLGGAVYLLGAVGGLLMILSLFTPVGWLGLLGLGLVALASGFSLGRWWSSR